jgi:hypothetical protein
MSKLQAWGFNLLMPRGVRKRGRFLTILLLKTETMSVVAVRAEADAVTFFLHVFSPCAPSASGPKLAQSKQRRFPNNFSASVTLDLRASGLLVHGVGCGNHFAVTIKEIPFPHRCNVRNSGRISSCRRECQFSRRENAPGGF